MGRLVHTKIYLTIFNILYEHFKASPLQIIYWPTKFTSLPDIFHTNPDGSI